MSDEPDESLVVRLLMPLLTTEESDRLLMREGSDALSAAQARIRELEEALRSIEKLWWFDDSAVEDCKNAHRIATAALNTTEKK